MESRKRFKADISDKYIQAMFDKSRRKRKQRTIVNSDSKAKATTNTVTSIPSDMLVQFKVPPRQRDIAKPENWIVSHENKPSRSEVLKAEKDRISDFVKNQQGWSNAARNVKVATSKPQSNPTRRPLVPDEENDDEFFGQTSNPVKNSIQIVRKNHSREFLQSFFKRASLVSAKKEVTSKCS